MLGLGQIGKLGAVGRALASLQKLLWPTGTEAGMWIDPPYMASLFSTRKDLPCLA